MLSKLSVLSLLAVVAARPTWTDLESYTFEKYMSDFNLKYPHSEIETRRSLFVNELARVRSHNAKTLSWKEGINHFSALTSSEKKASFGRAKGAHAASAKTLKHGSSLPENFSTKPVSQLPKKKDWREDGVVSVIKDQGHCGSCWAFASTATIESHVALSTGLLFDLSVQQIAMCAPNPDHCGGVGKCEGSTAELAFDYLTGSKGIFQEYQYGYESYYGQDLDCKVPGATTPVATINGYIQLPGNNYTALMNVLATVGPVAINVDASTFHAYESGIFDGCNQASPDVNHVVVTVGYGEEENGDKYWIVRNSWNPKYGEAGYIRLKRSDDDDENCGSDVTPQDGVACSDQIEPVKVCGTCGAIYDSSYPTNAKLFGR